MKDYTNFDDHALKVNTDDFNVLVVINPGVSGVNLALKTVTYDGESFEGLISNISNLSLATDSDLQNIINQQSLNIELLVDNVSDAGEQYQDLLTGALLNEDVTLRLILGSAQDDFAIQTFYLYDYEVKYGKLILKVKSTEYEEYQNNILETGEILQFGDFGNNLSLSKNFVWQNQGWFYHSNRLAKGIKQSDTKYLFCTKEMNDVPSGIAEFYRSFYTRIYSAVYNRGYWLNLKFDTNTVISNSSEDGCYLTIAPKTQSGWEDYPDTDGQVICAMPQPYSGAEPTYDAGSNNLIDGNTDTSETLDIVGTGEHSYAFDSEDIAAIKDAFGKDFVSSSWSMGFDFGVIASGEQITIQMRLKSTDALIDSTYYLNADSNLDATYNWLSGMVDQDIDNLDNYYWVIFAAGAGITKPILNCISFGISMDITDTGSNSIYNLKLSEINNIYMRCEGIQYDDDWDSRVTVGNLIERPTRILEYLARLNIAESKIDMDQFDVINTIAAFDTTLTIEGPMTLAAILMDFSKTFGINLLSRILSSNTYYPVLFDDGLTYPNSGTTTPDDNDKFSDSLTIASGEFDKNPILKDSVKINLKPGYGEIIFNYSKVGDLYIVQSTSGSGLSKTVNTDFFSSEEEFDNADTSLDLIDRYIVEKRLIELKSFINAFVFEPGDALFFEHFFLDHFELASIKGVVYSWVFDFMKRLITIKMSEVSNAS